MTLLQATQELERALSAIYDEREARNIAGLVMEHLTGWGRMDRVLNRTQPFPPGKTSLLHKFTDQLKQHRPVQYVLGEAWFWGMKLCVNEHVLIPRPETEELVEWVVQDVKAGGGAASLLDVGTGSGCIAMAVKKEVTTAHVHACDISRQALGVASRNARDQQVAVNFILCDFLDTARWPLLPEPDILVSNPPYIPGTDKASMLPHVLEYEPHGALFVPDADPLLFYRAIGLFMQARSRISAAYMEIHEAMGTALIDMFRGLGFPATELRKDLQQRDRMLKVVR